MPFNGAGVYSPPAASFPAVAATLIESAKYNAVVNDQATALSSCLVKDGQQTPTANLPMGGYVLTGLGSGAANRGYSARIGDVQDSAMHWVGSIAGTNTITGTLTPAITAYAAGQKFIFVPANTNTGATTVNWNSVGAKNVFVNGGACSGGELVAGVPAMIVYDGTQFHVLSRLGSGDAPVGAVSDFAGSTAPGGWLLCYGQEVSRTTYAALFAVVGETYGAGDSSTTFNLPDLRGRVGVGKDDMGGAAASRVTSGGSGVDGATLGAAGGDELQQSHTHTGPSHTHTGTSDNGGVDHTHTNPHGATGQTGGAAGGSGLGIYGANVVTGNASAYLHAHTFTTAAGGTGATGSSGSGSSQNMQPAVVLNKIIKF